MSSLAKSPRPGGEYGRVTNLSGTTQTINLQSTFENPVVFATLPSNVHPSTAAVRVDNITSSSFDISIQNTVGSDPHSDGEAVSYFVFEAGRHVMNDGTILEVGTLQTDKLVRQTGGYESVQYSIPFASTPSVLSQVQTFNDPSGFTHTRENEVGADRFSCLT